MTRPPDDGDDALARVRRVLIAAPVFVAGEVSRALRDPTDDRLDRLMRTPARRLILDGIFWQMPRMLDPERSARIDATVRWCITRDNFDGDVYDLVFDGGGARAVRGAEDRHPRLTIALEGGDFVRIATGHADPVQAYFAGRVRLRGDVIFAARLASLFRPPRRP